MSQELARSMVKIEDFQKRLSELEGQIHTSKEDSEKEKEEYEKK